MNLPKRHKQILNELGKYLVQVNTSSHLKLPYTLAKEVHKLLVDYNPSLVTKQRIVLIRASKSLARFREDLTLMNELIKNMKDINNKSFNEIREECNLLKENYIVCFLKLIKSFNYMKNQLEKITSLVDNPIAEFMKRGKDSHSRTVAILKTIKQFAEDILIRLNKSDIELKNTELSKRLRLQVLTQDRSSLTTTQLQQVEDILKNSLLDKKLLLEPLVQTPHEKQFPVSPSSCSLTELEDFVYNVMSNKKNSDKEFNEDVSLKDLLAAKGSMVISPIATTEGCIKDLENISKGTDFDPKKVKKIEFSDKKIADQLKEAKDISNSSIDKIVLDNSLRNQSKKNILRHKDYVMWCKEDDKVNNKEVPVNSLMSSFDLPNDTQESYVSISSIKGNIRKSPRGVTKLKSKILGRENSFESNSYADKCLQKKLQNGNFLAKEISEAYSVYYNKGSCKQNKYLGKLKEMKRSISNSCIPEDSKGNEMKIDKLLKRNKSLQSLKKKIDSISKLPSLAESKKGNIKKSRCIIKYESKSLLK